MNFLPSTRQPARYLSATLAVILLTSNINASAYEIIDLGADVSPQDINNAGVVVGARNASQYPGTAFSYSLSDGAMQDINGTVAYAINDAGRIAGSTVTGAFVLDGNRYRFWDDQGAWGINANGEVSGAEAGQNPYRTTSIPYNPSVYQGNKWTTMDIAQVYPRGTRQGVYADIFTLFDINDSGHAVGSKRRYGLAGSSAILITPPYSSIKSLADVSYLSIPYGGVANAINNGDFIVGTTGGNSSSGAYSHAFLYNGGTVTDLGTLGGLTSSASDINEYNLVVGSAETGAGNHAFSWTDQGGMQDLNDLIAVPGWELIAATAVNDQGDIVGTGHFNGVPHGFVLTGGAVPPPSNQPPVTSASADPSSGRAPLTVMFASNSTDADGYITSWSWDFGDGSVGSGANPVHEYTQPGTYIAELTVLDDGNLSATTQLDITVRKARGKRK